MSFTSPETVCRRYVIIDKGQALAQGTVRELAESHPGPCVVEVDTDYALEGDACCGVSGETVAHRPHSVYRIEQRRSPQAYSRAFSKRVSLFCHAKRGGLAVCIF